MLIKIVLEAELSVELYDHLSFDKYAWLALRTSRVTADCRDVCATRPIPGDTGRIQTMDHADLQLEIRIESIYYRIRRPIGQLSLKPAVTQKYLQARRLAI